MQQCKVTESCLPTHAANKHNTVVVTNIVAILISALASQHAFH
jgi:hypothetical protein